MKTLLIAAAAAASLAGAALPAAAQSWDRPAPVQYRPIAQRFDHGGDWRLRQIREEERRLAERRRIEWLTHQRHDHDYGYGYRR